MAGDSSAAGRAAARDLPVAALALTMTAPLYTEDSY